MAADLLDRDPTVPADPPPTPGCRTRVLRVFAARNRSGAWVYLADLGWRRVTASTPAGSRDLLAALCRARLTGTGITVEVTGTTVLAVTAEHHDTAHGRLPEPRFAGVTRGADRCPPPPAGAGR